MCHCKYFFHKSIISHTKVPGQLCSILYNVWGFTLPADMQCSLHLLNPQTQWISLQKSAWRYCVNNLSFKILGYVETLCVNVTNVTNSISTAVDILMHFTSKGSVVCTTSKPQALLNIASKHCSHQINEEQVLEVRDFNSLTLLPSPCGSHGKNCDTKLFVSESISLSLPATFHSHDSAEHRGRPPLTRVALHREGNKYFTCPCESVQQLWKTETIQLKWKHMFNITTTS